MSEYHSGSSLKQHTIRDLLLPSNLVWLLYLLISLILLVFLNIPVFGQLLVGESINAEDIAPLTDRFLDFQDRLGTPIVMVFWLFIGVITYTFIWLSENVFFIAKGEVEASQYVRTNPSLQRRYWETTIASNVFLVFIVLLWISFIALYLRLLLPAFSTLFHSALFSAPIYERFLDIVVAIIGNALAIYLILLMRRVITLSWRTNRP
ncbi:hypothetical protein HYU82_01510 [Candidatus Saccharibacteria bacterium]|nr:hypothetical protein [Candidatus Saccharibacteria bacterium]MBI2285483.1 hypothetical protein [Candidatus Saccharibacteria bacterium]